MFVFYSTSPYSPRSPSPPLRVEATMAVPLSRFLSTNLRQTMYNALSRSSAGVVGAHEGQAVAAHGKGCLRKHSYGCLVKAARPKGWR